MTEVTCEECGLLTEFYNTITVQSVRGVEEGRLRFRAIRVCHYCCRFAILLPGATRRLTPSEWQRTQPDEEDRDDAG